LKLKAENDSLKEQIKELEFKLGIKIRKNHNRLASKGSVKVNKN